MKISGLQENIKQSLFVVNHIANKNINLPILNNILIEAKDGKIRMTTTNLEIGIINTVRGKIDQEGVYTVDSKIISDYISLLPNKKIDLELKEDELLVSCDNYKTKIKGQSAEEFPLIPEVDREKYYSAEISAFKKALAQVVFAASTGDSRIELSGILFIFNQNKLTMAATDSYRLAEAKLGIKSNSEDGEKKIIIPAKTLQELIRIISGAGQDETSGDNTKEIRFFISDNQILFTCGSMELVSRLIEGQYPDYEQIIPAKNNTKVLVHRQELVRAVKAGSLFSKSGINDINLDFPAGKNKVVVSSTSTQAGESISEVDGEVAGDDNGVVVNYRYLLDGLNNIEGEAVKIEVVDGNTPCILKPEKGGDYLYIIMPIKQ